MTGVRKAALTMVLTLLSITVFGASVSAHAGHEHDITDITKGQVVNRTIFVSGERISMDGEVEGDYFCLGQDVTISGRVQGDVICAAQRIRVTGTVEGNLRLAAQDAVVSGSVGRSLSAAAENVTLEEKGRIARDASIAATRLAVQGEIGRDLYTAVDKLDRDGQVGRDIVARQDPATRDTPVALRLITGLSLIITAVALVCLAPRLFHSTFALVRGQTLRVVLIGMIAGIAVWLLIFALFVSLVGIPLAIFVSIAWLSVLLLAGPVAAYAAGQLILGKRTKNDLLIMLTGVAVLLVLLNLPFINVLTLFATAWVGSGALLSLLWGKRGTLRHD